MENPWLNLKKINNEYIAECDKEYSNYLFDPKYGLKLKNLIPSPYTGDPKNSVIYLLALNSGYTENIDEEHHMRYESSLKNQLVHKFDDYPFMPLNPCFAGDPGYEWWYNKLQHLIKEFGIKYIANILFNIEYFPYRSKEFNELPVILPSQKYTFSLVEEAINNEKIIIIMRSKKYWYKAIPKLEDYKRTYILRNPQNPVISSGNMDNNEFQEVINELKATHDVKNRRYVL